ncbi:MAG: Nif3-like dinuclear metal center hexameric protein [Bacteroidales bacterium]|nr:Nif3-like dinuclear metal center hexameric protein [Bacteroidales bacterium]
MGTLLLQEIISEIESFAPLSLQESYDNSGLQVGHPAMEVTGILITLDVTKAVLEEAIANHYNLIVAHHPVTLSGIKKLTGQTTAERLWMMALQNNLAIYAAHTNLDSVSGGVSTVLADKIGLINQRILEPRSNLLVKLVTFVPHHQAREVRQALFDAGAGKIGEYDQCSYNVNGEGTFRGNENTHPFAGESGLLHTEPEVRIETIVPEYLQNKVIQALLASHPYEEPAFDLIALKNQWNSIGFGIIGELPEPLPVPTFLQALKRSTNTGCIRYTEVEKTEIRNVAVCGGSGSFLLKQAIRQQADVLVTGDFKYHQFFEGEKKIMIADIGHYESEQFTKELFFKLLTKKFPNFAVRLSNVNSNPIKYI